jgi:hypothetical protein
MFDFTTVLLLLFVFILIDHWFGNRIHRVISSIIITYWATFNLVFGSDRYVEFGHNEITSVFSELKKDEKKYTNLYKSVDVFVKLVSMTFIYKMFYDNCDVLTRQEHQIL